MIVARTLYSSTKDHLNEFATLRALGSSSGYIHKVILAQAALSAILGYALGMSIALLVVAMSIDTSFPIIMTPELAIAMLAQAAIGSLQALVKRMDRQLEGRDYICGEFSLADISLFLTLAFARTMGLEVQGERVNAWYERVLARPAIAAEFQLMMAGVAAL